MNDEHNTLTYQKLALAASFYLEQAFNHLDVALLNDYAAILFRTEEAKIIASQEDIALFGKNKYPEGTIAKMRFDTKNAVSEKTKEVINKAFDETLKRAKKVPYKFKLNHKIQSIEILGHINNFAFFLDVLINRHLLFLMHTNTLNPKEYNNLKNKSPKIKLNTIKKKLESGNINGLNNILALFTLRNRTVHFTPENADYLEPQISELIEYWRLTVEFVHQIQTKEKFEIGCFVSDINQYSGSVLNKWTRYFSESEKSKLIP